MQSVRFFQENNLFEECGSRGSCGWSFMAGASAMWLLAAAAAYSVAPVFPRDRSESKSGLASPNFFLPDLVNFLKLRAHAKKELLHVVLSFFLSLFQIY